MITLKHAAENVAPVLSVAAMMLYGSTALAQNATQTCKPAQVIPLTGTEPARKARHRCPAGRATRLPWSGGDLLLCGEHAHCTGVRSRVL